MDIDVPGSGRVRPSFPDPSPNVTCPPAVIKSQFETRTKWVFASMLAFLSEVLKHRSYWEVRMTVRRRSLRAVLPLIALLVVTLPVAAHSTLTRAVDNAGPVFGITTGPGEVVLADAGQGIVRLRHLKTELVAALPGAERRGRHRPESHDRHDGRRCHADLGKAVAHHQGRGVAVGRPRRVRSHGQPGRPGNQPRSVRRAGAAGWQRARGRRGRQRAAHRDPGRHDRLDRDAARSSSSRRRTSSSCSTVPAGRAQLLRIFRR